MKAVVQRLLALVRRREVKARFLLPGQGVFQCRGDLVPETRKGRLHHSDHGARTQTERDDEPQLFLELLRFREMLLWITQIVGKILGANLCNGIEYEAYKRLTATN